MISFVLIRHNGFTYVSIKVKHAHESVLEIAKPEGGGKEQLQPGFTDL